VAGRVAGESLDLQPPGPSNAESRCDQCVQNRAQHITYYEVSSNPNGLVPHTRESMVSSYSLLSDLKVWFSLNHDSTRKGWIQFGCLELKLKVLFESTGAGWIFREPFINGS
jgi:hypothetical protein